MSLRGLWTPRIGRWLPNVTEMVEDTDNAATHFLQGKHVVDLEGPAPNLQDSIDKMIETVER